MLRGSLHGNYLASFSYLFHIHGYKVVSLGETRDPKYPSPNSRIVRDNSNQYFVGNSREMEELEKYLTNQDKLIYRIPDFAISKEAGEGWKEFWKHIDFSLYSHILLDMGTGFSFQTLLENRKQKDPNLEKNKLIGVAIGEPRNKLLAKFQDPWFVAHEKTGNIQIWEPLICKGFSQTNQELIRYIKMNYRIYNLPLEPIYSAKTLYTLESVLKEGPTGILETFPYQLPAPDSHILYLHQGGLLNWLDLFLDKII